MWSLIGNDLLISYLRQSLDKGTLSQAYIFSGLPHVGKMTLALLLAQAVNCLGHDKPCGECLPCRKIAGQVHPDVQIIKLLTSDTSEDKKDKSEIIIDQIRKLQHWANLPPYEGRWRVFIFEQAELMNEEAANCLLKTLEEPLPKVLFILLTTDKSKLRETIVSRCQHLGLKPVDAEQVEDSVLSRGASPDKAMILARLSAGAPGWAINALENEEELTERSERLNMMLDLVSQGYETRFQAAESFAGKKRSRIDNVELMRQWQGLWRDLLLVKTGRIEDVVNIDMREKLAGLSSRLSLNEIAAFTGCLSRAVGQLEQNANSRLSMEVLMLDMPGWTKQS
jgi:DNA polymerase-3 subunit delta'